ncbi:MAG: hypothetical protein D6E12_13605 [Desulfovibrio sp.]|nr:MAG: hypothetical protein D6E12_13605 [Desulfovibrio sp.]
MNWVTAARFSRAKYTEEEATRRKADGIRKHLEELALDVGLDPEKNVAVVEGDAEVKIGLSEEFDLYLREAPGEWRYY